MCFQETGCICVDTINRGGDKRVRALPKDFSLKMNVNALQEFELTYYNVAVQHVSHPATGTASFSVVLVLLSLFRNKWAFFHTFYKMLYDI